MWKGGDAAQAAGFPLGFYGVSAMNSSGSRPSILLSHAGGAFGPVICLMHRGGAASNAAVEAVAIVASHDAGPP